MKLAQFQERLGAAKKAIGTKAAAKSPEAPEPPSWRMLAIERLPVGSPRRTMLEQQEREARAAAEARKRAEQPGVLGAVKEVGQAVAKGLEKSGERLEKALGEMGIDGR